MTTYTWNGGTSGDWTMAGDWLVDVGGNTTVATTIPGAGDGVVINAGTAASTTNALPASVAENITVAAGAALHLTFGNFDTQTTVTASGNVSFNINAGLVTATSTATVTGGNSGTIALSGGATYMTWDNSGLLLADNPKIEPQTDAGVSAIDGVVVVSGGTAVLSGSTFEAVAFEQDPAVLKAQIGTLALYGFHAGDTIDLPTVQFATLQAPVEAGDVLTLSDGSLNSVSLRFATDSLADLVFTQSADGTGGTDLTVSGATDVFRQTSGGAASGDWSDPAGWVGGTAPGTSDVALLDSAGTALAVTASDAVAGSVFLLDAGGSLAVTGDLTVQRDVFVAGGLLSVGGGGTLDAAGLQVLSDLGSVALEAGAQVTLSGGGTALLITNALSLSDVTLDVAAGTIEVANTLTASGGSAASFATQIDAAAILSIGDLTWSDSGGIEVLGALVVASGGTFAEAGDFSGTAFAGVGGTATPAPGVAVDGGAITVGGTMGYAGTFDVTNGHVAVTGAADLTDLSLRQGAVFSAGSLALSNGNLDDGALSITGGSTVAIGSLARLGNIPVGDISNGLVGRESSVTVDATSRLDIGTGGGSIAASGVIVHPGGNLVVANSTIDSPMTVAAGGTVTVGGTLLAIGSVTVDGTVVLQSGLAGSGFGSDGVFTAAQNGTGTFSIGSGHPATPNSLPSDQVAGGTLEFDSAVAATETIAFAGSISELVIGAPLQMAASITGFDGGSPALVSQYGRAAIANTIELSGVAFSASNTLHYDAASGRLTLDNPASTVLASLQLAAGLNVGDIQQQNDGGDTAITAAPCFRAGTRLATTRGAVAVEQLRVGDLVLGPWGEAMPVAWIGHRAIDCCRHPRPHDVWPVRVQAGAFGSAMPARDLYLSPDHAVFVAAPGRRGVLVPIRYLRNGATVAQIACDMVSYWHVELPRHAIVLAEGLPAESFLDTGNRAAFANGGAEAALHPDFALARWQAEGCAPLVRDGEQLAAIRRRLIARLPDCGFTVTADPALRLLADGRSLRVQQHGAMLRVALPPGTRQLCVRSRVAAAADLDADSDDRRPLGVALAAIWRDHESVPLSAACLASGWHECEDDLRWSDGDGRIMTEGARTMTMRLAGSWLRYVSRRAPPEVARSA